MSGREAKRRRRLIMSANLGDERARAELERLGVKPGRFYRDTYRELATDALRAGRRWGHD